MSRPSLVDLAGAVERLARSFEAAAHSDRPQLTMQDYSDLSTFFSQTAEDLNSQLSAAGVDTTA